MTEDGTVKISFRLETLIHTAIEQLAASSGIETNAYIQRIIRRHALESGVLDDATQEQIGRFERIIEAAVKRSQELYGAGKFDQHFILTVVRDLMETREFRDDYEKAVGGDAYQSGLPGKSPLNMFLGWYIKNAVGADPVLDASGKPRRTQVRNEPIQSYTLLREPSRNAVGTE